MRQILMRSENLWRRYGSGAATVNALADATFEIFSGEFIVVLGPSGSGKSTLLNMLGGMDCPTGGRLWFEERELTGCTNDALSRYRRDYVGFVFQFFNLIPSLTALENVALAASIVRNAMDSGAVMKMVGLNGREHHFPSQLSGGEQQRVSIARAIVKKPRILLCDEPTGALDSVASVAIVALLLDVRKQLGCPVVAITHNAEMARVADRVFHMKDGRIDHITVNEAPIPAEELEW
ncbi:MAG: ABC transporter ATP-binding protein [Pygmaiobacter sp.]|nr:ABC transporter ATP-binding protein [Pygmaiobacter sp.]